MGTETGMKGIGKRVLSGGGMGLQRPVNGFGVENGVSVRIGNELRVVAVVGGGAGVGRGTGYEVQGLGC